MLFLNTLAHAGDVTISAMGFFDGHPGNGTFVMHQAMANGKAVNCWSQNADNNGWVMSLADSGILTVTYCRYGFPNAVYRKTGAELTAQDIGLTVTTTGGPAPKSVTISP